jgi:polysaccharide biosynthesis protein PslE
MTNRSMSIEMFGLRETLTIVFKHKRLIILFFAIVALAALIYSLTRPVTYDAKSRVLVKFGREFVEKSEIGNERQSVFNQNVMSTEVELFRSAEMIAKVIASIGPEKLYPELLKDPLVQNRLYTAMALFIEQDLKVAVIPNTSIIDISFRHPNPTVAVETMNRLIEYVKEKHLQVYSGTSTVFLEQQFKNFSSQLKDSETKLERFKQQHGVFSLEEQRSALIQQRTVFETNLLNTQNQIKELESRLFRLKTAKTGETLAPEVRARLAGLYEKEHELLQNYKESSRVVQNIRNEIRALKNASPEFEESSRRMEVSKLEADLATMKTKADVIRQQANQITGQLQALDSRVTELQGLKRDVAVQENSSSTYLKKLEEARISDDMDRQKLVALKVIEEAFARRTPIKRSAALIICMGLIGGILLGVAFAFLLEFLSPVMTTPLDAERRLGLPVMVAISNQATD